MYFTKQSWGLTALAATSGLGAYLLWRTLYPVYFQPSQEPSNRKKTLVSTDSDDDDDDDRFIVLDGKRNDRVLTDASERTCSTLGDEEIEQVWQDKDHDVNLKILRQLLERKEEAQRRRRPHNSARPYSRLSLLSHLLTRLEQALDERSRIKTKLGNMRLQQHPQPHSPRQGHGQEQEQRGTMPVAASNTSVCMVVQRYRGATLQCNENEIVRVGANATLDPAAATLELQQKGQYCGLLIYVSFAKGCTQQAVQTAAKIVVNLPLLSLVGWGDGVAQTMNVIDLAKQHRNAASITIVPQADLINKVRYAGCLPSQTLVTPWLTLVIIHILIFLTDTKQIKSHGKSIQYHSQIDKSEGKTLYQYFVNSVRGLVLEQQCQFRNEPLPTWYSRACSAQSGTSPERPCPSIPPEDLFRRSSLYKSWDDNGIPLTDAEDEPITKSAQKKLRKAQAAHRVRHLQHQRETRNDDDLKELRSTRSNPRPERQEHIEHWATAIDPSFVHVVAGTFGTRQSLEFVASMGPLCHVVQL